METWDALTSRRNIREFEQRPIDSEVLDRILEAGRRAPSARNVQPWDYVVVTDPVQLTELAKVWQGAGHVAGAAAAIALVTDEVDDERSKLNNQYDLGQATMAIMIAAADAGVGTGHASVGDQDKAREVLGFPDGKRLAYVLDLGYPADRPLAPIKRPNRRPFDEVVHRGRW